MQLLSDAGQDQPRIVETTASSILRSASDCWMASASPGCQSRGRENRPSCTRSLNEFGQVVLAELFSMPFVEQSVLRTQRIDAYLRRAVTPAGPAARESLQMSSPSARAATPIRPRRQTLERRRARSDVAPFGPFVRVSSFESNISASWRWCAYGL